MFRHIRETKIKRVCSRRKSRNLRKSLPCFLRAARRWSRLDFRAGRQRHGIERAVRNHGASGVRLIADAALVVAAHRNFAGAPRLERAHQDRRGKRRPDEQELLKRRALDRPEGAKQCDQKRNWQDGRHFGGPGGDKPVLVRISCLKLRRPPSVPSADRRAPKFVSASREWSLDGLARHTPRSPVGPDTAPRTGRKVRLLDSKTNSLIPVLTRNFGGEQPACGRGSRPVEGQA